MSRLSAGATLQQKLTGKLTIAPQLAQSLKILAMDALALEQYIETVLETNPLLERDSEALTDESAESDDAVAQQATLPDEDWEAVYTMMQRDSTETHEQNWHQEESLHQQLHQQLACEPMDEERRRIAHAIVDSLDDDGYFRADSRELCRLCGCDERLLWDVLCNTVQQLEPAGIAARDVIECLTLQLRDRDIAEELRTLAETLLTLDADVLAGSDERIAKTLACEAADVAAARALLRHLDASPGRCANAGNMYIFPELCFQLDRDGHLQVEVRRYRGLSLRLNPQWQGRQWQGDDKRFIQQAEQEANWLLQALSQRTDTLLRMGCFLADYQRNFLIHGALALRPLTLAAVAQACGVHESTISRLTHGKFAQTPLGVIDMRSFFAAGVETRHGEAMAVPLVMRRIRQLISREDPRKPLSDQAIASQLDKEGILLARRTVSKYREQLGIGSTRQRKQTA